MNEIEKGEESRGIEGIRIEMSRIGVIEKRR